MSIRALVFLIAGLGAAGVAHADGNTELGKAKSTTCQACHGPDGKGIAPNYPILAGQHAAYLEHALKQYKNGERKNPIMGPLAQGLSDADIADLSAYYAAMESALVTPEI
jgi:cytochrome c553